MQGCYLTIKQMTTIVNNLILLELLKQVKFIKENYGYESYISAAHLIAHSVI